jgi:HlyD family secretion protein
VAVLENADYAAQVLSARADLQAKQAALRKVVNGARSQERSEALPSVHAAQAVMDNARLEAERRRKLAQAGVISEEELDRYTRAYNVAREQYREAVERHSLIDDRAREEDIALADSDLALAHARLAEAEARYQKTVIRSPSTAWCCTSIIVPGRVFSTFPPFPIRFLPSATPLCSGCAWM